MANQVDNLTLNDDTSGFNRTVNVASDDLFLSVDLTLQSGAILTADNIKRGTADPNVALVAGNEGDVYQRTLAATGELWVNTDGTTTGWAQLLTASGGTPAWSAVLAIGNTSGGTNPVISSGDSLLGEDNGAGTGGDLPITAGSSTAGNNDGGDVVINPGSGTGTGTDGIVQVNGPKHYANSATDPTLPAPAEGDRYYNTVLDMDMRYDSTRSKWLSVETCIINASDQGTLNNGSYFQVGTLRMSSTRGYTAMFAGTIVSLGYTRTDSDAASFAVTSGASTIASVASSAVSGQDTTLDGDFIQGAVVSLRNDGANALSNGVVWCRLKWRA
jgi:hypothetical protein